MAIISNVPELEVRVFSEGQPLVEYTDRDLETKNTRNQRKIGKYVESTTGKYFSVEITTDKRWYNRYKADLYGVIEVDGKKVHDEYIKKGSGRMSNRRTIEGVFIGVKSKSNFRRFQFAQVERGMWMVFPSCCPHILTWNR
jgi:hypothetical protein